MTAPLRSSQHPATQTAAVAEFRCLYTPDVRKKQKKWQDGFLKFHAFNSRVMVYDQARNFLGDTYYKDADTLYEGDELTLDKGVMVEVADAMGVTHTDLTPLFEKKTKDGPLPPPPTTAAPAPAPPQRRFQPPSQVARPHAVPSSSTSRANAQQPRHKSLTTLLGTPKGPIGKSVPIKSPYEARQEHEAGKERQIEVESQRQRERGTDKENDLAVDRPAKRQKTVHRSTNSTSLPLPSPVHDNSPAPKNNLPLWAKTLDANTIPKPARAKFQGAPVITLDKLDAAVHVSPDATLHGTPPMVGKTATRSAAVEKPIPHTPKIPRGKVPVPSVKALDTPQAPAPPCSPPVSASNRLRNIDFAVQPTPAKEVVRRPSKQPSPPRSVEPPPSPPRHPKAKSLRLSKGVKRGTLMMCQPLPLPRSKEVSKAPAVVERTRAQDTAASRRATSVTSGKAIAPKTRRKTNADDEETRTGSKSRQILPEVVPDIYNDDQEVIHGLMDQQLRVSGTAPPESILIPDSPEPAKLRPEPTRAIAARVTPKVAPPTPEGPEPVKPAPTSIESSAVAKPQKTPGQRSQPNRRPSRPPAAGQAVQSESRAASPALSAVSDSRSRTASLSPRKLAALSTGGFRKKTKSNTPQPTISASTKFAEVARNETVALPPHPLRANKKGPVMTTTELAAMLQQPQKKAKAPVDPIDDGADAARISPNRKFRRVRSENDAPIPSASEDWEKKNLSKVTAMSANAEPEPAPPIAVEPRETPAVAARKKSGLAALIKKTDPRKKFVRTRSLTVETTHPLPQEADSPMVSPIVDKDVGPWSTEAFDLFDWRPPGREKV